MERARFRRVNADPSASAVTVTALSRGPAGTASALATALAAVAPAELLTAWEVGPGLVDLRFVVPAQRRHAVRLALNGMAGVGFAGVRFEPAAMVWLHGDALRTDPVVVPTLLEALHGAGVAPLALTAENRLITLACAAELVDAALTALTSVFGCQVAGDQDAVLSSARIPLPTNGSLVVDEVVGVTRQLDWRT